jgi:hypothetical protein
VGKVHGKRARLADSDINELQFAEKVSSQTLADARGSYDALYDRVQKLVALVAGASGGAGVFVLGKPTPKGVPTELWPLAALAIWWFVIAAAVLHCGGRSRHLKVGTTGLSVGERFRTFQQSDGPHALWLTRWDHLAAEKVQIEHYAQGTSDRAKVLDKAYYCLVLSPLPALLAFVLTHAR